MLLDILTSEKKHFSIYSEQSNQREIKSMAVIFLLLNSYIIFVSKSIESVDCSVISLVSLWIFIASKTCESLLVSLVVVQHGDQYKMPPLSFYRYLVDTA